MISVFFELASEAQTLFAEFSGGRKKKNPAGSKKIENRPKGVRAKIRLRRAFLTDYDFRLGIES
ncbi:MAG: hypothetical protein EBV25_02290 [Methylophilaceae bacterium]|nr:hypothetical protein [Methylophilaceae bacterium]NCA26910.1 hypothetical protein [Methylophilaceae bacterium]NCW28604.1 hypothetical protein [Verrucomicrobiota bacterium]